MGCSRQQGGYGCLLWKGFIWKFVFLAVQLVKCNQKAILRAFFLWTERLIERPTLLIELYEHLSTCLCYELFAQHRYEYILIQNRNHSYCSIYSCPSRKYFSCFFSIKNWFFFYCIRWKILCYIVLFGRLCVVLWISNYTVDQCKTIIFSLWLHYYSNRLLFLAVWNPKKVIEIMNWRPYCMHWAMGSDPCPSYLHWATSIFYSNHFHRL